MDNALQLLGSFLVGAVAAAGAVYAWLSSRIKLEHQRVLHVEQSRQQALEQVTQARKQIEQLQRESHELRLAIRPASRHAPVPAPEPIQDPAEAARLYAESKLNPQAPKPRVAQAFKDTVVLRRTPE